MNLPNLLTLLRMALVPVVVVLVAGRDYRLALVVFAAAGLTDGLDGLIARQLDQKTSLGAILDPLADKFLLVTSFLLLALHQGPVRVPVWIAALVVGRDLILLLSATAVVLHSGPRAFEPSILGKLTTAVQIVYIAATLLANASGGPSLLFRGLGWATFAATLASGLDYLRSAFRQPGATRG